MDEYASLAHPVDHRAEVERLRGELAAVTGQRDELLARCAKAAGQIEEAIKAADEVEAALRWYADPANHECRGGCAEYSPVFRDDGQRARKALGLPEPA